MDTVVLVDVLDSHGMMISRQRLPLIRAGPALLIGRDVACDVVVNDPYAAARHAELSLREDGTLQITALNTVNGLILRGERMKPARPISLSDGLVQIGHSHLRIRSSNEVLAPERPDLESLRSRYREYGVSIAGFMSCSSHAAFMAWIGSPDDQLTALATHLLVGALALTLWFAFWVVVSRSVRSRWQWSSNAAITLGTAAALLWLDWLADAAIFATGMRWLEGVGEALVVMSVGIAIYLHTRTASRLAKRRAATIACVLPLIGFYAYVGLMNQRYSESVTYIPHPGEMFPPSWSHQPGMRLDKFFDEGLDLRDMADQQRAHARLREAEDSKGRQSNEEISREPSTPADPPPVSAKIG